MVALAMVPKIVTRLVDGYCRSKPRTKTHVQVLFKHCPDHERLAGLARGFGGFVTHSGVVLSTERARKCLILYRAGFEYSPSDNAHAFSRDGERMVLWRALALAKKT